MTIAKDKDTAQKEASAAYDSTDPRKKTEAKSAEEDQARASDKAGKKLTRIKLDQNVTRADREYRTNEVIDVEATEAKWMIDEKIGHEVDEAGRAIEKEAAEIEAKKTPAQKMVS
jgi:hypothetical protein